MGDKAELVLCVREDHLATIIKEINRDNLLPNVGLFHPKNTSIIKYQLFKTEELHMISRKYVESEVCEDKWVKNTTSTHYRQIIPYIILKCRGKILCYQRCKKTNNNFEEPRLLEKYSIGIGGHINRIYYNKYSDIDITQTICKSIANELEDELGEIFKHNEHIKDYIFNKLYYHPDMVFDHMMPQIPSIHYTYPTFSIIGIIFSDSTSVNHDHLGLAIQIDVSEITSTIQFENVSSNDGLINFKLLPPLDIYIQYKNKLEDWSLILLEYSPLISHEPI